MMGSWWRSLTEQAGFAPGGGTPGGADTEIQFNNGGAFGGDPNFTFDPATQDLEFLSIGGGSAFGLQAVFGFLSAGVTNNIFIDMADISHLPKLTLQNSEPINNGILINSDSPSPSNNIQIICQDSVGNIQSSIQMSAAGDISLNSFDGGTGFNDAISITEGNGINIGVGPSSRIGFYGQNGPTKQTIVGAKLPGDTVIANLLTALELMGLIVNSTT